MADFDLAIIGGGINGAGIARDAAGRGLKVVLLEQSDLASGTSSASSKLIHGGLRYLEHGALRLVRAALSEREVLLRMAPHLIRPLRFVLPLDSRYRSPAVLRLGLFIYDMIGRREILPGTRTVDLAIDATGVRVAYRKMWLGDEEAGRFTPGPEAAVLTVDGWRLGLAICKDTGVPQHAADTAINALAMRLRHAGKVRGGNHDQRFQHVVERGARMGIDEIADEVAKATDELEEFGRGVTA